MAECSHLDQVVVLEPAAPIAGCEECLKIDAYTGCRTGLRPTRPTPGAGQASVRHASHRVQDSWVHLRTCQSCGVIGCCDSSPNRHASRHAHEAAHPVARSVEPGETWSWCYVDEVMFVLAPG